MKIERNKNPRTGVKEIDDQHRNICLLMDQCQNLENLDRSKILKLMRRAEKEFSCHFETEEKIMKEYRYLNLRSHTDQHKKFKKELNKLLEILEFEGASVRFFMLIGLIMSDWFTDHFHKEDSNFSCFIRKK